MSTKNALMPFLAPAVWLAVLGLAAVLGATSWGQEGHPSNGIVLLICALLAAPLFGLAGCVHAWLRKSRYSNRIFFTAVASNVCVAAAGLWFWLSVWST